MVARGEPICLAPPIIQALAARFDQRDEGIDGSSRRLDHSRGQIAHFKIPPYVRIVDRFEMTVTGKAQKFEMRAIMERELGLGV